MKSLDLLLQKVRFSRFDLALAFVFVFVSETEEGVGSLIYLMARSPLFMSRRVPTGLERPRSFNKPSWKLLACR